MPWPDIFYKAKAKKPAQTELPPPFPSATEAKPGAPQPPSLQPVPVDAAVKSNPPPLLKTPTQPERSTRTIPVVHGVILRPPARPPTGRLNTPTPPATSIKNIEQLMNEADPVKTLSQSGSVRLLKRLSPETSKPSTGSLPAIRFDPTAPVPPTAPAASASELPRAASASSPWPSFQAKAAPVEVKKAEPLPPVAIKKAEPLAPIEVRKAEAPTATAPPAQPLRPAERDTTFLPRPTVSLTSTAKAPLPGPPPMIPLARRMAKLTDVARIVLPPKREETGPLPPASGPSTATVVPPSFPVPSSTQRLYPPPGTPSFSAAESPFLSRATVVASAAPAVPAETFIQPSVPDEPAITQPPLPFQPPLPRFDVTPKTDFEAPKLDPDLVFKPGSVAARLSQPDPAFESVPQPDTEAHRPAVDVLPKLDLEAHKAPPPSLPTETALAPAPATGGSREFHLTNGERVVGRVLSETPDTIYLEHATLGVLTIPQAEVATRLVEIILINGDRIVGNVMAETPDMLYVRHASLGMLSVPRAQRSTRVVEAILKDGDRILGEVLTETETFTVIKSATLGTVTVPHHQVAMLNRKVEQIEMKALPPALPDKPAEIAV